jgi:hypothetical protein
VGVPSREARLAHAGVHCQLWNDGRKDEWVASWRTIIPGSVRMLDPMGTKAKHGFEHATTEAYDLLIKTYYDVPAEIGEGDDPYEFLLGKENVIPND